MLGGSDGLAQNGVLLLLLLLLLLLAQVEARAVLEYRGTTVLEYRRSKGPAISRLFQESLTHVYTACMSFISVVLQLAIDTRVPSYKYTCSISDDRSCAHHDFSRAYVCAYYGSSIVTHPCMRLLALATEFCRSTLPAAVAVLFYNNISEVAHDAYEQHLLGAPLLNSGSCVSCCQIVQVILCYYR